MSNNFHKPNKPAQDSFDAAQWRTCNADVSAQRDWTSNFALALLLGVMVVGVAGLYMYNSQQKNRETTKAFVANVLDEPDAQQNTVATNINKVEPVKFQTSQVSNSFNLDAEMDKYNQVRNVLRLCGAHHREAMRQANTYYYKTNDAKYSKLYDMNKQGKTVSRNENTSKLAKSMKRMDQIESKTDALKFLATGGAARHMDASMGFMSDIKKTQAKGLSGDALREKSKDYGFCVIYAGKITSGKMNVRLPKP